MGTNKQTRINEAVDASMYKYPYQNLSLVDMTGEEWKLLPGYEDYIEVSNMGRIKSIARYIEMEFWTQKGKKITTKVLKPSIIRKQTINSYRNHSLNETGYNLSFEIVDKSINLKKYINTARAVYMAFISKEVVANARNSYVKHYDKDPFNNRIENLYPILMADLHKKMVFGLRSVSSTKFTLYQQAKFDPQKALLKKMRKPKTKPYESIDYPYQNKSLADMEGEVWKPMSGEEGYFVSNMGRFKALPKEVVRKRAGTNKEQKYHLKEQIVHQRVRKHFNSYLKEARVLLQCFQQVVPRLVYSVFVEPVKYEEMVMHKDSDPYNNRIENLYLSSDKTVISKYNLQPVTQYDLMGNRIATYASITEASQKTGMWASPIGKATMKENKTAGGYLWRKGIGKKKIDVSGLTFYLRSKR